MTERPSAATLAPTPMIDRDPAERGAHPSVAHSTCAESAEIIADIPVGYQRLPQVGGPFTLANGPLYVWHEGPVVKFGFRVETRHTNPMGVCHGGMMATFCDMLVPLTAHRTTAEVAGRFLPTISLQVDYLAPAPLGAWVEGEGQVLRVTRSLLFGQGLVRADGVPCARLSGVFKLGPAFPLPPA